MTPYNVELFRPDFSYRASAQVEMIEHVFDYLDIEKAPIEIPGKIEAEKGDWIRIVKEGFEANGIISDIKEKDGSVKLSYKPFHKIFDVGVYVDVEKLATETVEQWLEEIITGLYIENEDALQNIKGLETKVISGHEGQAMEAYESGINNLHDIMVDAFTTYGIVCDFEMDVQRKRLVLKIGSVIQETFTIEADLGNIFEKEIIIKEADESTNKLIIYNEEDYAQKEVYYLTEYDEVTSEDRDRISPVVCDTVTAKASASATFSEVAKNKAEKTLKPSQYDNLIEITVSVNDELVRPTERRIGQQADIISGGKVYRTIMTGMRYDKEKITLVFGAIRLELTKILKRRFKRWE